MSSIYWLARAGIGIAGWTPRPVRYGLGSTISSASYLGWRSKRLVTQQNMSKVLGLPVDDPRVRRAAFASWSNYGRTASDLIYFPHIDLDHVEATAEDLTQEVNWREYASQALIPGKGAIIASAHFGSWDMAGAIVAREFPLSAIVETFKDPRLDDLLQGHRRAKNIGIIPLGNTGRPVLQELRQNHMVAIIVDRPMTRETGTEVTFFGHKTYVPGGPATLALKCGAAILPGFVWYTPQQKFYLRAFPPVFPQPCHSPEERKTEVVRLTQYIYNALEEVIREWPTQWFMFRRFWPAEEEIAQK